MTTTEAEVYKPNGRDTVFVLDDRDDIVDMTTGYFESAGVPAVAAKSIDNAWSEFEQNHARIRVAFIDMNLRKDRDGGLKFLEEARERYPKVVFVLITGWTLLPAERGRIDSGHIDWLDKGALAPASLLGLYQNPKFGEQLRGLLPAHIETNQGKEPAPASESGKGSLENTLREETIHALRTENWDLRGAVRELAGDLVRRLRIDKFSPEETGVFLDGRDLSVDDLIEEIQNCTPLGIRLIRLHFSVLDDLIHQRRKRWWRR